MNRSIFRYYHLRRISSVAVSMALVFTLVSPIWRAVSAAGFDEAFVRFDRMSNSTTTGGRVCVTPSPDNLANTEASVQVEFPPGFSVNATASNWTVNTSNLDTGQTAWPGIATATSVSGRVVTFPSGNLASSSNLYCFNFSGTNTLVTPASTGNDLVGNITTRTSGPATIDSSEYATSVIADDQISITASVGATFTFAMDGNTDSFGGHLDVNSVNSTSGRTVSITSNAAHGWYVWARSQNDSYGDAGKGALESSSADYTIPHTNPNAIGSASHTLTPGTEDYGLGVELTTDAAGGGIVTINPAYNTTGQTRVGVLSTISFRPIASSNGTANEDVLTLIERATISTMTPAAADYTDVITVVAAGAF